MDTTAPTTEVMPNGASLPEDQELTKVWQEYLQKCCEVGQIRYNLKQIDGQTREMEKNLEVTERAVVSAAAKHRDLQQKKLAKIKPKEEVAPSIVEMGH